MSSSVYFVPLTTPEAQRTASSSLQQFGGTPPRGVSTLSSLASASVDTLNSSHHNHSSHYSPNSSQQAAAAAALSPILKEFDSFDEAAMMIRQLRADKAQLEEKVGALELMSARGPGIMGARIKAAETKMAEFEDIAVSRAEQSHSLGAALRTEIDLSCKIRDEQEKVVDDTSAQIISLWQKAKGMALVHDAEFNSFSALLEQYVCSSSEMASLITQQAAKIAEQQQEIIRLSKLNVVADQEIKHFAAQSEQKQRMAASLQKEKEEVVAESEKQRKRQVEVETELQKKHFQELEEHRKLHMREKDEIHRALQVEKDKIQEEVAVVRKQKEEVALEAERERRRMAASEAEKLQQHLKDHYESVEKLRAEHQKQRDELEKEKVAVSVKLQKEKEEVAAEVERERKRVAEAERERHRALDELRQEHLREKSEITRSLSDRENEKHALEQRMQRDQELLLSLEEQKKEVEKQRREKEEQLEAEKSNRVKAQAQLRDTRRALATGNSSEQDKRLSVLQSELEEDVRETRAEKSRLERGIDAEDEQIDSLQRELDDVERKGAGGSERLRRAIAQREESKKRLKKEVDRLDAQMEEQQSELKSLRQSRDAKEAAVTAAAAAETNYKTQIENAAKEKSQLAAEKAAAEERLQHLAADKTAAERERSDVHDKIMNLTKEHGATAEELARARMQLKTAEHEAEAKAVSQVRAELQSEITKHQVEQSRLKATLQAKEEELTSLSRDLSESKKVADEQRREKEHAVKSAEEKLQQKDKDEEKRRAELDKLEQQRVAQYEGVVRKLLSRQRERCGTILNEVSSLGAPGKNSSSKPVVRELLEKNPSFQSRDDDPDAVKEMDRILSRFRLSVLEGIDENRLSWGRDAERKGLAAAGERQQQKLKQLFVDVDSVFPNQTEQQQQGAEWTQPCSSFSSLDDLDKDFASFRTALLDRVEQRRGDELRTAKLQERKRIATALEEHQRSCASLVEELDAKFGKLDGNGKDSNNIDDHDVVPQRTKEDEEKALSTATLDKFDRQVQAARSSLFSRLDALLREERRLRTQELIDRSADALFAQQKLCDTALHELDELLALPERERQRRAEAERKRKAAAAAAEGAADGGASDPSTEEITSPSRNLPVRKKPEAASIDDLSRELRIFGAGHLDRTEQIRDLISSVVGVKAEFDAYKLAIESSKEFRDQADVSELRRQLASTKAALSSTMRMEMARGEVERHRSPRSAAREDSSPAVGGAFAGAATSSVSVRSSRSSRLRSSQRRSAGQHDGGGGGGGGSADDGTDNDERSQQYQQQRQQPMANPLGVDDNGLTQGSLLDIDTMKEMTRMRWTSAQAAFSPFPNRVPSNLDIIEQRRAAAQAQALERERDSVPPRQ